MQKCFFLLIISFNKFVMITNLNSLLLHSINPRWPPLLESSIPGTFFLWSSSSPDLQTNILLTLDTHMDWSDLKYFYWSLSPCWEEDCEIFGLSSPELWRVSHQPTKRIVNGFILNFSLNIITRKSFEHIWSTLEQSRDIVTFNWEEKWEFHLPPPTLCGASLISTQCEEGYFYRESC